MRTACVVQKETIAYLNNTWCEIAKRRYTRHWMLHGLNKCFPVWDPRWSPASCSLRWTTDERTSLVEILAPRSKVRREAPPRLFAHLFILPLVADSGVHVLSWCVKQPCPIWFERPGALGSCPRPQEQTSEQSASVLVWVLTSYWCWCLETHDWNEYILFFLCLSHCLYHTAL